MGTIMKRDSFPALTIIVLIFGVAALLQSTMGGQKTNGCLWDNDSLAAEARNSPGITKVITGRFDRFPDLYYQVRLDRVKDEVVDSPDDLEMYDNAGVACDRLNRHDDAIEWMAQKRIVLDRFIAEGGDVSEHEYRYLANLGTFYIHRWLAAGADRSDLNDVERSRELIAAAIELNPDAHFGRERYQLLAIDWILTDWNELPLPGLLQVIVRNESGERISVDGFPSKSLEKTGYSDAVEGLSGLITLGAAWESVDIFNALSRALSDQGDAVVAALAQMRVDELLNTGHQSLSKNFEKSNPLGLSKNIAMSTMEPYFMRARAEADGWVARRNFFITDQLALGLHPDTHPDFWDDWEETTSPPRIPLSSGYLHLPTIALIGIILLSGFLIFRVHKRLRTPAV